jgi:hypothetical protein
MSALTSALLLVGSPRKHGGTSELLGGYVLGKLAEAGVRTSTLRIVKALARGDDTDRMLDAVSQTDLLLLAFPVYVDTLPAQTTRTLQLILQRRQAHPTDPAPALAALTNCGFAEGVHTRVALDVCALFARQAGLRWLGGLGMPMGGAVNEGALGQPNGMLRHQLQALDLAAACWMKGEPAPPEAAALMETQPMPGWLYRLSANMGWRQAAHNNRTEHPLNHKPYKK